MTKIVHSTDLVARYGEEEFAVILPNTRTEIALEIASRITANKIYRLLTSILCAAIA